MLTAPLSKAAEQRRGLGQDKVLHKAWCRRRFLVCDLCNLALQVVSTALHCREHTVKGI